MRDGRTILLVDDNQSSREACASKFKQMEEFVVLQAATAAEGIFTAINARPHVILLDGELPDMDGAEACRLIRKRGIDAPILIVSNRDSDTNAILGLEAGANDYIVKPARFSVLLARVRAHLRTHDQNFDMSIQLGPYEFLPLMKLLIDGAQRRIKLTDKESSILRCLSRVMGSVVTRETIIEEVWGPDSTITVHTLETHIHRLRQKIEPNPNMTRFLVSEGGGYVFYGS